MNKAMFLADLQPETKSASLNLRVLTKKQFPGKKVDRLEMKCTDGSKFVKVVAWSKTIELVDKNVDTSSYFFKGLAALYWLYNSKSKLFCSSFCSGQRLMRCFKTPWLNMSSLKERAVYDWHDRHRRHAVSYH